MSRRRTDKEFTEDEVVLMRIACKCLLKKRWPDYAYRKNLKSAVSKLTGLLYSMAPEKYQEYEKERYQVENHGNRDGGFSGILSKVLKASR